MKYLQAAGCLLLLIFIVAIFVWIWLDGKPLPIF